VGIYWFQGVAINGFMYRRFIAPIGGLRGGALISGFKYRRFIAPIYNIIINIIINDVFC
jgi:hypothetical protein